MPSTIDVEQVLAVAMRRMRQGAPTSSSAPTRPAPGLDWDDINTRATIFMHAYTHCTAMPKPPAPASAPVSEGIAGDMAAAAADAWPQPTCATCAHFSASLPPSVQEPDAHEDAEPTHFGLCENAVKARLDHKVHRQPIGAAVWAVPRGCKGYLPIRPAANL